MNILRRHKGVTLLEILIVIVIIGIISSSMYLSVLNMSASADANTVINNMTHIKMATIMWYRQNMPRIKVPSKSTDDYKIETDGTQQYFSGFVDAHGSEILRYLQGVDDIKLYSKNNGDGKDGGTYSLVAVNKTRKWYVCYNLGKIDSTTDTDAPRYRLRGKLAGRATGDGSVVLFGRNSLKDDSVPTDVYTEDKQYAFMLILTLP